MKPVYKEYDITPVVLLTLTPIAVILQFAICAYRYPYIVYICPYPWTELGLLDMDIGWFAPSSLYVLGFLEFTYKWGSMK